MYTMTLLLYQISVTRRPKQTFDVPMRMHHKQKYFEKTVCSSLEIRKGYSGASDELLKQMHYESLTLFEARLISMIVHLSAFHC